MNQWRHAGGSALVSLYAAKTFSELGFDIKYVTTTSIVNSYEIEKWFGFSVPNSKTYNILSKALPLFGIYQRHLIWIPLLKAIKYEDPDIVWIDTETYKPLYKLQVKNSKKFKLIEYIHFPYQGWLEARDYFNKYSSNFWRIYFAGFLWMYKITGRNNPFEDADIVFTNSKWTANIVKKLWNNMPEILYPPVKIDEFLTTNINEKEDAVIMVGRISPEKRYEDAIKAISLSKSKPLLRIIGGLIPTNVSYLITIKRLAEKLGLKIEIYPNAPRTKIRELLQKSKIFVHSVRNEHFGIAIIEGMASNCVPIVHKSGGAYYDIIDEGKYGLYYENLSELSQNIDNLLYDEAYWKRLSTIAKERAKIFNENTFKDKIKKSLYKLLND